MSSEPPKRSFMRRFLGLGKGKGKGEPEEDQGDGRPLDGGGLQLPPLRVVQLDELKGDNVHSRALVAFKEESNEYTYYVVEPGLDEEDSRLISKVKELLSYTVNAPRERFKTREDAEAYVEDVVVKALMKYGIDPPRHRLDKAMYYIKRDLAGYGKVDVMMRDPYIEDVSCDGVGVPVYVWHKDFESIQSNVAFSSLDEINSVILRFAYVSGKSVSLASPILDSTLPDGSRVNAVLGGQVATRGGSFTIRKFTERPFTITELMMKGTLDEVTAAYFWELIEHKKGLVIAGATASGKTTTLNALANFIHPDYKVVSIEDTRELRLHQQNWTPMLTRSSWGGGGEIDTFELLRAALRQRPDYIIVGEVRGQEAYTLLQAMSTGHGGLTTIHAEDLESVIARLASPPISAPKALIATSIDAMAMQQRMVVGGVPLRRVVEVSEVMGYDQQRDDVPLRRVIRWNPATDKVEWMDDSKLLGEIAEQSGVPPEAVTREMEEKRYVLRWMVSKRMTDFQEVANVIRDYYRNRESVVGRVMMELGPGPR